MYCRRIRKKNHAIAPAHILFSSSFTRRDLKSVVRWDRRWPREFYHQWKEIPAPWCDLSFSAFCIPMGVRKPRKILHLDSGPAIAHGVPKRTPIHIITVPDVGSVQRPGQNHCHRIIIRTIRPEQQRHDLTNTNYGLCPGLRIHQI